MFRKPSAAATTAVADRKLLNKVMAYLGTVEPREVFKLAEPDLEQLAWSAICTARSLGVTKIGAFKKYAYLWGLTDGQIAHEKEATDFIRFGGANPDAQVDRLLKDTIATIRANGLAGHD